MKKPHKIMINDHIRQLWLSIVYIEEIEYESFLKDQIVVFLERP